MHSVRKAQILTFLITLVVGLCGLFIWQPRGDFADLDSALSPAKNESFRIGAQLEDQEHTQPRARTTREVVSPSHSPLDYVICEIDDDPEGINAFGIYHPTDLSITLRNLHKQGVKHVFIGTHLRWPELDPAERNALSSALALFDSVAVSTPLKRSVQSELMPESFLRSSISVDAAEGETELLPLVGNLALPPDIHLPDHCYIGFSKLESEKPSESIPLVARWDDRLVFSAYVIDLMLQHQLAPENIQLIPGQYLRLGNQGHILPIDHYGHFHPDPGFEPKPAPRHVSSALSGEVSIIGATQKLALVTATGERSSVFNTLDSPYSQLSSIAYSPRIGEATTVHRLPQWLEVLLVIDLALLGGWMLAYRSLRRNTVYVLSLFVSWMVLLALYHLLGYYTPGSIYILTLLAAWATNTLLARPSRLRYLASLENAKQASPSPTPS